MKIFYSRRKLQRYHSSKLLRDYDIQNLAGLSFQRIPINCKSLLTHFNTNKRLDISIRFYSKESIKGTIIGEIRKIKNTLESRGDISSGYIYYNMFVQYYRQTIAVKFYSEEKLYQEFYRYFIKQFGDYSQLIDKLSNIVLKGHEDIFEMINKFNSNDILQKIKTMNYLLNKDMPVFESIELHLPYTKEFQIYEIFEDWKVTANEGIIVLEEEDLKEDNLKINAENYYNFVDKYYLNDMIGNIRVIYLHEQHQNLTVEDIINKYKQLYKDDIIDYTKFSYINNVLYKDNNSKEFQNQIEQNVDKISNIINIDKKAIGSFNSILFNLSILNDTKVQGLTKNSYQVSAIDNINDVLPKVLRDWEAERMEYLAKIFDTPHLTREMRIDICKFRYYYKTAVKSFNDNTLLPEVIVNLLPSEEIMKRLISAVRNNLVIKFNEESKHLEEFQNYIVHKTVHKLINYVLSAGLEIPEPDKALREEFKIPEKEIKVKPIDINSTIEEIIEYSNITKTILNPTRDMAYKYINSFIKSEEKKDSFYINIIKEL